MITKTKYKTFWKRLLAGVIDGLVFIPFFIIEGILLDTYSRWMFIGCEFFYTICWMSYFVIGHGKYGQTFGKKIMKIKVFDINEINLIGYKRAFLRESVWFFVSIAGIIWLIIKTQNVPSINEELSEKYGNIAVIGSSIWFVINLLPCYLITNDEQYMILSLAL